MDKSKLRLQYKKIRENIQNRESKSRKIAKKVIQSDFYKKSKVIAIYSSLSLEVDTTSLITRALNDGKVVALPKMINNGKLEFYCIFRLEELEEIGAFAIKEPLAKRDNYIDIAQIELMIIPGVCFDKNNNRVGYGKGFFDRYLAQENNITKVGICFEEQVLQDGFITVDEHDVKMDLVITDKEIYK